MTAHSWTARPSQAPEDWTPGGCLYCSLPYGHPEAAEIVCQPRPATPEAVAWLLRDKVSKTRAMKAASRPDTFDLDRELAAYEKQLHDYLDTHGLAGTDFDDR